MIVGSVIRRLGKLQILFEHPAHLQVVGKMNSPPFLVVPASIQEMSATATAIRAPSNSEESSAAHEADTLMCLQTGNTRQHLCWSLPGTVLPHIYTSIHLTAIVQDRDCILFVVLVALKFCTGGQHSIMQRSAVELAQRLDLTFNLKFVPLNTSISFSVKSNKTCSA